MLDISKESYVRSTVVGSNQIVKEFRGPAPVLVTMETEEGPKTLQFGPDFRVEPAPDFFAEVKALLGEAAVL